MVKSEDSRSKGREFETRASHSLSGKSGQVTSLQMCLCLPSSINGYLATAGEGISDAMQVYKVVYSVRAAVKRNCRMD